MTFHPAKSLLETTLNTRDLGGYRSAITGGFLNSWRILRSDVQNHPSDHDTHLLQAKSIRTVIDLRGRQDVLGKPNGFSARNDFTYLNIPIEEGSGVPESADVVSESYLRIAESKNMVRVFQAIASASSGVIFNCTAGKDRTGVVSALLLGLCGVSEEDIIFDYMLTKPCNRERFDLIHQNFPEIDMNIVIPNERYMAEFLALLHAKYGSFQEYFAALGMTNAEISSIKSVLI